jgi:transposase
MMTRRYGLRDDQWERIKDWLPGREGHVGRTAKDNRLFVEAVLYRYRVGIPWRDLPELFGDFRIIHTRNTRWSQSGVWQRQNGCIFNTHCAKSTLFVGYETLAHRDRFFFHTNQDQFT